MFSPCPGKPQRHRCKLLSTGAGGVEWVGMGTGKSRGFAGGPSANSPGEPSLAAPQSEERLHLLPLLHAR